MEDSSPDTKTPISQSQNDSDDSDGESEESVIVTPRSTTVSVFKQFMEMNESSGNTEEKAHKLNFDDIKRLLRGVVLMKHMSKTPPSTRVLYLTEDLEYLCLARTRIKSPKTKKIRIADIRDVIQGCCTPKLQRRGREETSFAIMSNERSFDLECYSPEERTAFLSTFCQLLKYCTPQERKNRARRDNTEPRFTDMIAAERKSLNTLPETFDASIKALLTEGATFVKHRKFTAPGERKLSVCHDLSELQLLDQRKSDIRTMKVTDVTGLYYGLATERLHRRKSGKFVADPDCSFVVAGKECNFDMEAPDRATRDVWVGALRYWLQHNKLHTKKNSLSQFTGRITGAHRLYLSL